MTQRLPPNETPHGMQCTYMKCTYMKCTVCVLRGNLREKKIGLTEKEKCVCIHTQSALQEVHFMPCKILRTCVCVSALHVHVTRESHGKERKQKSGFQRRTNMYKPITIHL